MDLGIFFLHLEKRIFSLPGYVLVYKSLLIFPGTHWFAYPIIFQFRKSFPIGHVSITSVCLVVMIMNVSWLCPPLHHLSPGWMQQTSNWSLPWLGPLFPLHSLLPLMQRPLWPGTLTASFTVVNTSFPLLWQYDLILSMTTTASAECSPCSWCSSHAVLLLLLHTPAPSRPIFTLPAPSALMAWPRPLGSSDLSLNIASWGNSPWLSYLNSVMSGIWSFVHFLQ